MKFERDLGRQDSSRRRLDGLHELCQIAFAGVNLASIEFIPPAAKRMITSYITLYFRGPISL